MYTEEDGLVSNGVTSAAVDMDNVKWFGTTQGLSRYEDTKSSVQKDDTPAPFRISSVFPNPFNSAATIEYSLPAAAHVSIFISNAAGQKVTVLGNDFMSAGKHTAIWNSAGLPSGLFFCTLKVNGMYDTRKMLHLK